MLHHRISLRLCFAFFVVTSIFISGSFATDSEQYVLSEELQRGFDAKEPNGDLYSPLLEVAPAIPETLPGTQPAMYVPNQVFSDLYNALATMQGEYFSLWIGKWTTTIDWTAAVMCTFVSATLSTFSQSLNPTLAPASTEKENGISIAEDLDNEIAKYFEQTVAFYYAEETFEIRMQAYDDILWVVLEWLESIQFINTHSSKHNTTKPWHAQQFIQPFAHRARIFYDLASQGWDWRLCGGGMTWNPRLLPYKNAITNQLYISASISMYLNFPGDTICSPVLFNSPSSSPSTNISTSLFPTPHTQDESDCSNKTRYDPTFLTSAINGYTWLSNIGMRNNLGLYTDGFHIANYSSNPNLTTCNERNEDVYTYNQGVILSGLRGLWEATGNTTYLSDGHELVANVVKATGWGASGDTWSGLGRNGVLMERCDESFSCNQDGQTFKGIFFHHLTSFCTPLPMSAVAPGKTFAARKEVADMHKQSCDAYAEWVVHNANAALATRDERGRFGATWGVKWNGTGDGNERGRGRTVETQGGGVSVVRSMYEFLRRRDG